MIRDESTWESKFRDNSFAQLVVRDAELAGLRRDHARLAKKKRRMAAEWSYDAAVANDLFGSALMRIGEEPVMQSRWPGGVEALAIDPSYAPALLSVGSIEHHFGRRDEAMKYFLALTRLPEDTKDLSAIIDKVGDFLIDEADIDDAGILYASAAKAFPRVGLYLDALGYCVGKQGHLEQALEYERRAVALEPENYRFLNDLGWSLVELKRYDEAESVLGKAVALSPPDYERARVNLKELERRRKRSRRPPPARKVSKNSER
jgi:tetratricopeptide (TPR) repeat protein